MGNWGRLWFRCRVGATSSLQSEDVETPRQHQLVGPYIRRNRGWIIRVERLWPQAMRVWRSLFFVFGLPAGVPRPARPRHHQHWRGAVSNLASATQDIL